MWRNPVMFVVEIVTVLTTVLLVHDLATGLRTWLRYPDQSLAVVYIAVREFCRGGGRGARQGAGRQSAADRTETLGKRLLPDDAGAIAPASTNRSPHPNWRWAMWCWSRPGTYSRDGEVIDGIASVDESAITGESAPVIREAAATGRR
jgi:K+-transporting ATPase ATPase B chain